MSELFGIDFGLNTFAYVGLIGLYVLAIYNCYRVVGQRLSSGATLAWIFISLALPIVGVPVYYLFGDFRIRGYVRRHKARSLELGEGWLAERLPHAPPDLSLVSDVCRETVTEMGQIFEKFGPIFSPQQAKVELLIDGESTFPAIFSAIENARSYILVQYYILRSDRMGLELKRLLVDKAKSGIAVYLLYDDMGSFWLSRDYIRDLRRAGVRVARFLPLGSYRRFFQMNFRNHRKTVVVDGQVAFTGGLNVGEEYASRKRETAFGHWRDTHVRIHGPSVAQLEDIFLEDWYFATGIKLDENIGRQQSPRTLTVASSAEGQADPIVQVIATGPTDGTVLALVLMLQLINTAKKRLWLTTPYFVPDIAIIRALELAVLRGVDVRLILPEHCDRIMVHWVSLSFAEQLQARGVKVLLYKIGFMHQKTILVDDSLSAVGTMNIDNRALYLNFETTVLIHSEPFAAELDRMLTHDLLHCRYSRPRGGRLMQRFTKLRANALRLAAPLL